MSSIRHIIPSSLTLILLLTCTFVISQVQKVILDTDLDSDVDDAGAIAMLHTFADNGRAEILGMIVTSNDIYAPLCVDAINHFYGRSSIPIGVEKTIAFNEFSKYTKTISKEFSHSLNSYKDAEDATSLYRRLLADQPDSSVTIITIGHLTNLMGLIESRPDKFSSLSGMELIRKKVKLWVCMGGKFPNGKEANFYRPDLKATKICVGNWPVTVIFSGWEIGNEIITGGTYLKLSLSIQNPVRRAYQLYNNFKGRQSWDQTAILYALSGQKYWDINQSGHCKINQDGSNEWIKDTKKGGHGYLVEKVAPQEMAKIIDALIVGQYKRTF